MAETSLQHEFEPSTPESKHSALGRIAALAHDDNFEEDKDLYPSFEDFTRVLSASGRWLLVSDLIALFLAFLCAGDLALGIKMYLTGGFQNLVGVYSLQEFITFFGLGAMALLWLDSKGHYRQRLPYWETAGHIVALSLAGLIAAGFLLFAVKNSPSRLWLGLSWLLFGAFILIGRALTRRGLERAGLWKVPTLLIGEGPTAQAVVATLARESEMGFNIVEQIPSESLSVLKKPAVWKRIMTLHGTRYILIALESAELEQQQDALKAMVRERLPCSIVPPWLGLPSSTLSAHHFLMNDLMMMHDTNRLTLLLPRFLKRGFDIVVAGLGLIAISPLFVVVALIVRLDGGPAFFRQQRVGRDGKVFSCYKFRSMRVDAEEFLKVYLEKNPDAAVEWRQFQKLKNDVRVTKFGDFIRRTSIDELPQLLNVLKGEMSLVGPRPIMPGQENYYADDFMYYEYVRPGITGPWQVSGRSSLTFKQRVDLESWYARNWSLWLDIVIILKTAPALLQKGQAF